MYNNIDDELKKELESIHSKILEFLGLEIGAFNFDLFILFCKKVELEIRLNSIDENLLSKDYLFLLLYYYSGCELSKKGSVSDLKSDFIPPLKAEKIESMVIEYQKVDASKAVCATYCQKGYCELFDNLIKKLTGLGALQEGIKKYTIGVAGHEYC